MKTRGVWAGVWVSLDHPPLAFCIHWGAQDWVPEIWNPAACHSLLPAQPYRDRDCQRQRPASGTERLKVQAASSGASGLCRAGVWHPAPSWGLQSRQAHPLAPSVLSSSWGLSGSGDTEDTTVTSRAEDTDAGIRAGKTSQKIARGPTWKHTGPRLYGPPDVPPDVTENHRDGRAGEKGSALWVAVTLCLLLAPPVSPAFAGLATRVLGRGVTTFRH